MNYEEHLILTQLHLNTSGFPESIIHLYSNGNFLHPATLSNKIVHTITDNPV